MRGTLSFYKSKKFTNGHNDILMIIGRIVALSMHSAFSGQVVSNAMVLHILVLSAKGILLLKVKIIGLIDQMVKSIGDFEQALNFS